MILNYCYIYFKKYQNALYFMKKNNFIFILCIELKMSTIKEIEEETS